MKVKITKLREDAFSLKRKFMFWWINDGGPVYDSPMEAEDAVIRIYKSNDIVWEGM